jgi:uncharacterized membrane protein YbhN (UPF0104 family)
MKKRLFLMAKLIVSIIILYFLFRKIDLRDVFEKIVTLPWQVLLFIIVTALIKQIIEIGNWYFMLCLNPNYQPKFHEIVHSHFIGQALRFLIPGGHAVVGKVFFVENKKKASLVSVGAEKFFQIWIILFFAAIASFFHFQKISLILRLSFFILMLLLPIILYYLKFFFSPLRQSFFKNYSLILPKIIFAQTLYILITITQYFVVLNSLSDIQFLNVFLAVPLILTANIIPITYAGLGLRETFAITVLAVYSIPSAEAITTSLFVFLFNTFLPALIGLGFFLKTKK